MTKEKKWTFILYNRLHFGDSKEEGRKEISAVISYAIESFDLTSLIDHRVSIFDKVDVQ